MGGRWGRASHVVVCDARTHRFPDMRMHVTRAGTNSLATILYIRAGLFVEPRRRRSRSTCWTAEMANSDERLLRAYGAS
jgi:hypothetical protein